MVNASRRSRRGLRRSRIHKKSGVSFRKNTLEPQLLDYQLLDYIGDRANKIFSLINSKSSSAQNRSDKSVEKAIEDDFEKVVNSDFIAALRKDYKIYGKESIK